MPAPGGYISHEWLTAHNGLGTAEAALAYFATSPHYAAPSAANTFRWAVDTTAAARAHWPELFVVWRWEKPLGGGGGGGGGEVLGGVFYVLAGECHRAPSLDRLLGARANNASGHLLATLDALRQSGALVPRATPDGARAAGGQADLLAAAAATEAGSVRAAEARAVDRETDKRARERSRLQVDKLIAEIGEDVR
jgi:hypothetical protein